MATGEILDVLFAQAGKPVESASAIPDTIPDGSTIDGYIDVLDFKGADNNTHAEFSMGVPENYDGGGMDFAVLYAMDGTVGTAVQFEVRGKVLDEADTGTSHNLQAQTASDITDTPQGTANRFDLTPFVSVTHANLGSPAKGQMLRLRLTRDYDHDPPANADDAQVAAIQVKES